RDLTVTGVQRVLFRSVVGEEAIALDLPGVEHLAAQRQDRLRLLVSAHLRAAARRIALDQEDLVELQVAALAVGELAGQYGDPRAIGRASCRERRPAAG